VIEELRHRTGQLGRDFLDILVINVREHVDPAAEAAHFCEVHRIGGTALLDETGNYADRLGVHGVPTNVIVDQHGTVRAVGVTTPEEITTELAALLGD
jgi:hypothetical protein